MGRSYFSYQILNFVLPEGIEPSPSVCRTVALPLRHGSIYAPCERIELSSNVSKTFILSVKLTGRLAFLAGIEPASFPSQGNILSIKLQKHW